jgi:hypothetical protein
MRRSRVVWMLRVAGLTVVTVAAAARGLKAIDLQVTVEDMEAVLSIARGSAAERAAFHAPYLFSAADPTIERIEVITERRRLALLAETHIAQGDPFFARGTLEAERELRPYRGRVSVVVRFRFPPMNAYNMAPPIDISLLDGLVPRLEMKGDTVFALSAGGKGPVPVAGAVGEAVYEGVAIGQTTRTVAVRLGDKEVARLKVDFSRLD